VYWSDGISMTVNFPLQTVLFLYFDLVFFLVAFLSWSLRLLLRPR